MKKIISLVLVMSMVLTLFACKKQEVAKQNVETQETKAVEQKEINEKEIPSIRIGMLARNTISEEKERDNMIKAIESFGIKNAYYPEKIVYYDELTQAVLALDRGDVDVLSLPTLTAEYIMNKNKDKYGTYPLVGTLEEYSMGALVKNKTIIEKIDGVIKELHEKREIFDLIGDNKDITDVSNRNALPHFEGAETYRVILTGDLPPMDYLDSEGKPAGFNVELLSIIADKLKVNFELVNGNAASRFLLLTSDKADIAFWTLKISSSDNNMNMKEQVEAIKNYDSEKMKSLMRDVPKDIVTTRPYLMQMQVYMYSKNSKIADNLNINEKNKPTSEKYIQVGKVQFPIRDNSKKIELTDFDKEHNITEGYSYLDNARIYRFEIDNKDKLSIEEYVENKRKEYPGCVENKDQFFGEHCLLHTFIYNKDGKNVMIRNYYFNDGDKIVGVKIVDDLKEVRLADSNIYAYFPAILGEAKKNSGRDDKNQIYESYESPYIVRLPSIEVSSINRNNIDYDMYRNIIFTRGVSNGITKKEYEALAKGGWTLEKFRKLTEINNKGAIKEELKGNSNGIDWEVYDTVKYINGEKMEFAVIVAKDGDNFINIVIYQPQKHWQAMGEAIAQTLHKK